MTATPAEPTTTPTAPAPPAEPSTAVTTPPGPKPTEPPTPPTAPNTKPTANPWEDPDAAKAEIERLRRENAKDRTDAKAQAAEDAKKEMAQTIGKALGLVEDESMDPAKLTESLTASQAEAKRARVELAVFRNATTAGGDPAALLDSSSFLTSLDGIDPSDSGAVSAAIEKAVETNPRLGAVTDPRSPAPNPAQGTSASGSTAKTQLTRAELNGMDADAIEQARLDGRLNDVLGIKT